MQNLPRRAQHRRGFSFGGARAWLTALLLLTTLAYLPGLNGPFLFDDPPNLILPLQAWLEGQTGWQEIVFGNHSGALGRPLSMLTFLANAGTTGLDVIPFKATNIAVHLACGTLLYILASRLLKRDSTLSAHAQMAALVVAAIWILHPMHVSTVLYVVQRMAQLSALFVLLALVLFVTARTRMLEGRLKSGAWLLFAGVPLATLAAMFSKENGALVPLLCAVLELCFFRSAGLDTQRRLANAFLVVGLLIPAILAATWYALHPDRILAGYAGRTFTFGERLLTEPRVLFDYMATLIVPRGAALGVYTDDFKPSIGLLTPPTTLLAIFGIVAFLLAAFWIRRKAPTVSAGILLFLVGHALESTIFPLELYFEHRNYLPSIGIFLALVGFVWRLPATATTLEGRTSLRQMMRTAGIAFCAILALSTFARASAWRHWLVLAEQGIRHHPESLRAHLDYASLLMAQGLYNDAEHTFERLTTLDKSLARQVGAINVVFVQCYRDRQTDSRVVERLETIAGSKIELGQMLAFEHLANRIRLYDCGGLSSRRLADIITSVVNAAPQPPGLKQLWRSRFVAAQLYAHSDNISAAINQAALAWMTGRADPAVGIYLTSLYLASGDRASAKIILSDTLTRISSWDERNLRHARELNKLLQ